MGRLDGKVAIITGGNSGIGAVSALQFAQEGAKVVISARRVEQLNEVADKIKAAVVGVTKNIAMRGAAANVRCNTLCPGTVITPMTTTMDPKGLDPDMMGSMAKHADMSLPPCQPQEVANAILFLASDESSAMTGQVMVIDHGANL